MSIFVVIHWTISSLHKNIKASAFILAFEIWKISLYTRIISGCSRYGVGYTYLCTGLSRAPKADRF